MARSSVAACNGIGTRSSSASSTLSSALSRRGTSKCWQRHAGSETLSHATWIASHLATGGSAEHGKTKGAGTRVKSTLPSIAILVNDEKEVAPIAEALNGALEGQNIKVVACSGGQVVGQENDARVFDVQHIKGLEFEAVFFVGIDQLAEQNPDLFDKYLYVGTTRAATYLGLSCAGARLPNKIEQLQDAFVESWPYRE
jgi:UvrD-like helicase family protein